MLYAPFNIQWRRLQAIRYDGQSVMVAFSRASCAMNREGAAQAVIDALHGDPELAPELLRACLQGLLDLVIEGRDGAPFVSRMIEAAFLSSRDDEAREAILGTLLSIAWYPQKDWQKENACALFDALKIHAPEAARNAVSARTAADWSCEAPAAAFLASLEI